MPYQPISCESDLSGPLLKLSRASFQCSFAKRDAHTHARTDNIPSSRAPVGAKNVLLQAKNDDNLWSERARRKVISAIISEWLKGNSKKTTVKKLMSALNGPGWFDVKLRVEKLLLVNVSTIS